MRRRRIPALLLLPLTVTAIVAGPGAASAEPEGGSAFPVTTTLDAAAPGGEQSLRDAVDAANSAGEGGTISLAAGQTYTLDLCGMGPEDANASGDLDLDNGFAVTIDGNGSTIQQTCDGERVFQSLNTPLTLQEVTVTGGDVDGESGIDALGGAILNSGPVTLQDAVLIDNAAVQGGAVFATHQLDLVRSQIEDGAATDAGGAIYSNTISEGVSLDQSAVIDNLAPSVAGIYSAQDLVATNSTISGNTNTAISAGSVHTVAGEVDLVHSLLGVDTSASGETLRAGTLTTRASLLTGPSGGGPICDLDGASASAGDNVATDASCGLSGPRDQQGVADLGLDDLDDNSGPTSTRLLLAGSPAIDNVAAGDCVPTVDQRGLGRPRNGQCEAGPVEVRSRPDALVRLGNGALLGGNAYGGVASQTRSTTRGQGQLAVFGVRVENDGEFTEDFRVSGTAGNANYTVRYRIGGVNRTVGVTGGAGFLIEDLAPGAAVTVELRITPKVTAPDGANRLHVVNVRSTDTGARDRIGAKVRVT